jgi:leucyl/phenylalanyl-tRNA--protein transferase
VLRVEALHLGRTLRTRLRRCGWETTVDGAFADVIAACAARPETWITPAMRAAYLALHRLGVAHSVEVWAGDRLAGGLYGVQVGAVFSGESMFFHADDAGKAAIADLVARFADAGGRLLDCQQETPHLARLGAAPVSRATFVAAVRRLRDAAVDLDRRPLPVSRLASR